MLGLVWQMGGGSAYDVRRTMSDSPSSQWSASTGAIYPLMRRLQRQGLLSMKPQRTGQRLRRWYTITPAGKQALRLWIGPPLAPEAVSVAHDPLRSRARFLGLLSSDERAHWVASAITALKLVDARVREWEKKYGSKDEFQSLVSRNGELETLARHAWLREMEKHLCR